MRLMEPSPGEAVDRITILSLKMAAAVKKGIDATPFAKEHEELGKYMVANKYNVPITYTTEMQQINSRLWALEDVQRGLLKSIRLPYSANPCGHTLADIERKQFCENALLVIELNDARAALVQKINEACGVHAPEKLHYVGAR